MNHTELKQLKKLLVDRVHDEDHEIKEHAQNLYDHIYITLKERDLLHVDHSKELKHLSLCTGYGGLDLALKRALGDVVTLAYVEGEAFALLNLVEKIEAGFLDSAPLWTDLKTFDWAAFSGKVDIISGGFPCQPFSEAGKKRANEDPRHLWPYISAGLKVVRPPLVFLENVGGILHAKLKGNSGADPGGTPVLLHVLRELERLGYKTTAGLFSARETGAPHQRKRVFILGLYNDLNEEGRGVVSEMLRFTEDNNAAPPSYPAPKNADQYRGEPPRVTVGNPHSGSSQIYHFKLEDLREANPHEQTDLSTRSMCNDSQTERGHLKPPMGGASHESASWVDPAQLSTSFDSKPDELRLLGNGVIPQVAELAFRILWDRLK